MKHDTIQVIEQSSFFQGLSRETIIKLSKLALKKNCAKNAVLFSEDTHGDSMFLLADGAVQLSKITPDGNEIVIRTIKPGDVFAEVVLFEKDRYPVTAIAVSKSTVYSFKKDDILDLLNERGFRNDFITNLMQKMRYLAERVRYLTSYDVEQRFFMFLEEHYGDTAEIEIDLSKKDLAAAIGTTPETFSRLTKRLQSEGKIEWSGKQLVIL
ncbi:hypothetical protein BVX97_06520 [bacterium E08(2017)]|nr:hypothetical protein BVX97_06520 [bacterium E08(2017)]